MSIKPFGLVEMAIKETIETLWPEAAGKVGGDLQYLAGQELYVWIGLIPGAAQVDQIEGTWAVDIDVFGDDYQTAMENALKLEALLLPGRHRTGTMNLDQVTGGGPAEIPWGDDNVFRISALYTFSARRV